MSAKIIIIDDRYPHYNEEHAVLEPLGAEILHSQGNDPGEIKKLARDCDGIIVNLAPIDADIIASLEKCRVIARYGVGYDSVDVDAATGRGIWVANVTGYCAEDVSDQAFALFMSCVRKVAQRDKQVRAGVWAMDSTTPHRRIKGKVFVLMGYGAIARAMHRKISGFQPGKVLVYDPFVDENIIAEAGATQVDWDTALATGDFFSIHMPLNDETRGIFNSTAFEKMKDTAIVVNTSRGPIVNEDDLYQALKNGKLDSAGIDVFHQEPVNNDNPLLTLDNITVSGHIGWYTEESMSELKRGAAENVKAVLETGKPNFPVNTV